jgi:CheY-like chemotaxis protein
VAHDLNNILAPILMVSGLLGEQNPGPETRRLLELMETAAQRGAGIVAQLLTFSRGLGGERIPLPIEQLVAEMARLMQETFPRNIEIVRHGGRDLPLVLANPTQVHQVLMNLCVNARDAMPQGGRIELGVSVREVPAEVAARHEKVRPGEFVVVTVSDTGHGIPPEVRRRIFDPFFTTKDVGKGTGLGLSTVLGIVRGHGGFIEVESEAGRGSRFEVYFPAQRVRDDAAAASDVDELPRGHGERLLVVDDEESIRVAVKAVLEQFGYDVVVASDVAEALGCWRTQVGRFQLVVTDLMMPGDDGWELVRQIGGAVPIIVCSGLGQAITAEEAARARVHCVLPKPFAAPALLREIARALALRTAAK